MVGFITNTIDHPWTANDVHKFETDGSQRDEVQYNSYYNWRIKLTQRNLFLCSIETNEHSYKNIYLFAVTRNLFYFAIYIPQLEVIKKLSANSQIKKMISVLPLTNNCFNSSNKELELNQDVLFLDGCCMLVKVQAPVDAFLYPRSKCITNSTIKKQYALLNNLYFQFEKEYDGLLKMVDEYDAKLKRKIEEQKDKLKRFLIRKGVRIGVSAVLADVTGGLSLGLDALFGLDDIADIQDAIDLADAADMAGDAMDFVDASDILDTSVLDFSVGDMDDINIVDVGEGDDLLADSYSVSFGSKQSVRHIDELYDPSIDRAYDKLADDVDRINKGDVYPWEDPKYTIKRDNESIKYWERAKSDALAQNKINEAKQNYWNAISDYCKESMSKKIHGS